MLVDLFRACPLLLMRELIPLLIAHGTLIVFLVTLAARAGAPVPAAPLLVVAGGIAMAGKLSFAACVSASIVANVLGDAVWYQAGRWRGHRVMKLLCQISLSPDTCVRQSEGILARWGGSSLVAAKFLPGVSVVAAPMAGALGMSWRRFVSFDAVAAFIWTAVFMSLGVLFSAQIQRVLDVMTQFGTIATLVILVALAVLVIGRWVRRKWMQSDRYAPRITVHELRELIHGGVMPIVIDVRSTIAVEHDSRRLPGAITVTLAELPGHAGTLPRDREIVLYCSCPNEVSAVRGTRILGEHGLHRARALTGGLDAWMALEATASPAPREAAQPSPADAHDDAATAPAA